MTSQFIYIITLQLETQSQYLNFQYQQISLATPFANSQSGFISLDFDYSLILTFACEETVSQDQQFACYFGLSNGTIINYVFSFTADTPNLGVTSSFAYSPFMNYRISEIRLSDNYITMLGSCTSNYTLVNFYKNQTSPNIHSAYFSDSPVTEFSSSNGLLSIQSATNSLFMEYYGLTDPSFVFPNQMKNVYRLNAVIVSLNNNEQQFPLSAFIGTVQISGYFFLIILVIALILVVLACIAGSYFVFRAKPKLFPDDEELPQKGSELKKEEKKDTFVDDHYVHKSFVQRKGDDTLEELENMV